jgi:hypothetical protein
MEHICYIYGQLVFPLDSLYILMTWVLTLAQRHISGIHRNSSKSKCQQDSPNSLNVLWYTAQLDMICTLLSLVTTNFLLDI